MANTFVKLGSASGSGVTTINFTSIPQTYKDLVIIGTMAQGANFGYTDMYVTMNGNTGSVYDYVQISAGFNTGAVFNGQAIGVELIATGGFTNNELSPIILTFQNYASTTTHKPMNYRCGIISPSQTFSRQQNGYGIWKNTAAVTSITLTSSSGVNFNSYSNVNLYGLASS
jgi:hypothetical protein